MNSNFLEIIMLFPIALGMPSGAEWLIIAAIGLLLFGKRLPEVGRSLGKGIVEFKKGLKGVEDDATNGVNTPGASAATSPQLTQSQPQSSPQLTSQSTSTSVAAPTQQFKFDPYTGKPVVEPAPVENSSAPQT